MLSLINRDRCNFYVVTSNAFGANRFLKQKQRNVSCPLGGEIFVSVFVSASPLLLPPRSLPLPLLSFFLFSFFTFAGMLRFSGISAKLRPWTARHRFDVDIFISTDSPGFSEFRGEAARDYAHKKSQ